AVVVRPSQRRLRNEKNGASFERSAVRRRIRRAHVDRYETHLPPYTRRLAAALECVSVLALWGGWSGRIESHLPAHPTAGASSRTPKGTNTAIQPGHRTTPVCAFHGPRHHMNAASTAPHPLNTTRYRNSAGRSRSSTARAKYAGARKGTNQRTEAHSPE